VTESFWAAYVVKLLVVAALLAALYFTARKLRQTRIFLSARRSIEIVEAAPLSPHAALYLLRVGARYFLLGAAGGNVSTLAELAPAELEATPRNI
jgi:flagellar biosynthetic protein FliO